MSTPELDRLIVEHLADLDAAAHRIEQMEARLWVSFASVMATWAATAGWEGVFDTSGELQLSPREWTVDGERRAWFHIDWGPDDDGTGKDGMPWFGLCRLTGVGGGQVCLWLDHKGYRNSWKPAARAAAEAVRPMGFVLSNYANFYTDCTPVQAEMARAFEDDDLETALAVVVKALDRAALAKDHFTDMMRTSGALPNG